MPMLSWEKGYPAWSTDITPETTPEAAGLGFAVRMDKASPFVGRDALLAEQAAGGPKERLRCIALEDPWAVCLGGEPVRIDRETAGRVTTGGYGYRVERSIAYAYLPADAVPGATVEIDFFGELVTGTVVAEPLYDPENARIRA